jgi:hypothetical protein
VGHIAGSSEASCRHAHVVVRRRPVRVGTFLRRSFMSSPLPVVLRTARSQEAA